jgi:hypothetical protein
MKSVASPQIKYVSLTSDTEYIENLYVIYGDDLDRLDSDTRLEAIAILALALRFSWATCNALRLAESSGRFPPELLAHMVNLTPKGMRTLINCLNCEPRQLPQT